MDHIRRAEGAVRGAKLTAKALENPDIVAIQNKLNLSDPREAIVIVVVAEQGSNNCYADIEDFANFLGCSSLDAASLGGAIVSLEKKGFIVRDEEGPVTQFSFADDIFQAIVEGREVKAYPVFEDEEYTQFSLCEDVHKLIKRRARGQLSQQALFDEVEAKERVCEQDAGMLEPDTGACDLL